MPRKRIVEVIEERLGAICEHCYPSGWDGLPDDVQSTGCAHGEWHPDPPAEGAKEPVVPAAAEEPAPPTPVTADAKQQ